ncbi:hypothetical protein MASR1M8_21360 [Thermomonas brevis]
MSLILEALRKSEAERRRGQAPDVAVELSPAPVPARINLARWLWPVLGLVTLFAALPVLAIWWATRTPAVPDATPAPVAAPVEAPREVATPEINAPAVVPRNPPPTPVPAPAAAPETATPLPAPPPLPAPAPPAPAPQAAPVAVGMGGVKLSMHLWNDDPARRFVVLNGQRMTEGERNGDLLLVEILRDGVLVEREGQRARIDLP